MKSILLQARDDSGFEARLQAALDLARAPGGHITCIQVTSPSSYVAFDGFGGTFIVADVLNKLEEDRLAFKAEMEARLSREGVAWDYVDCTDDPAHALVSRSALADVIVLSSPAGGLAGSQALVGDVAVSARTPVLVVPEGDRGFSGSGPVAIAWNGSFEAGNAVRAAMPLLKRASSVHLLCIEEEEAGMLPPLSASEYLSRHGVGTEIRSEPAHGRRAAEALAEMVASLGAGLLVMGAYGHSRARQFVFGGVTRAMLAHSQVPLLLAH